jgi:ribosomal protein S18 acetylase RimI-like enzyme
MSIRPLRGGDITVLTAILKATEVFTEDEILIAVELMTAVVTDEQQKDYVIFVAADAHDAAVGYTCIGPTPATAGTYDLYWIAVDPQRYGSGDAALLLTTAEEYIQTRNGALMIVETSSTPKYERTRAFYLKYGYAELARIRQYYRPGDDLIIYGKYFPTT